MHALRTSSVTELFPSKLSNAHPVEEAGGRFRDGAWYTFLLLLLRGGGGFHILYAHKRGGVGFIRLGAIGVVGFADREDGGVALVFLGFKVFGAGFRFECSAGIVHGNRWRWRVKWAELLCEILDRGAEVLNWYAVKVSYV